MKTQQGTIVAYFFENKRKFIFEVYSWAHQRKDLFHLHNVVT
jgi:hypothetical protein